jgi:predicted RNA-binding Zn ribbon-like protein
MNEGRSSPQSEIPVSEAAASPFVFVGGLLALDLVNTEVVMRGRRRDLLVTADDAAQWWALACVRYQPVSTIPAAACDTDADMGWLAELKELRAGLRSLLDQIVAGRPAQAPLAVLNTRLGMATQLMTQRQDGGFDVVFRIAGGPADAVLFAIAQSALVYLATGDISRLHRCGNPRCILYFADSTKSATRRWCSNGCMNRARSAQRYSARRA